MYKVISTQKQKPSRYFRGPVYWTWLLAAIRLRGSVLAVALVLWDLRTLRKSLTVRVGTGRIARFLGLSTDTVRRGLDALEDAGLIRMDCLPGRICQVTLFEEGPVARVFSEGSDEERYMPIADVLIASATVNTEAAIAAGAKHEQHEDSMREGLETDR